MYRINHAHARQTEVFFSTLKGAVAHLNDSERVNYDFDTKVDNVEVHLGDNQTIKRNVITVKTLRRDFKDRQKKAGGEIAFLGYNDVWTLTLEKLHVRK